MTNNDSNDAKSDFERYARNYGFDPSDFGRQFVVRGSVFTVWGLNVRARGLPLLALRVSDGRTYKFPPRFVKKILLPS